MKGNIYRFKEHKEGPWRVNFSLDLRVDVHAAWQKIAGVGMPSQEASEQGAHIEVDPRKVTLEQVRTTRQITDWRAVNIQPYTEELPPKLWDQEHMRPFYNAIAGRRLLPEEVVRFMEHHGLEHAEKHWMSYVQAGVMTGMLKLQSGMFMDRKAGTRCRRCGSSGEQLVRTSCLFCPDKKCLYCSACLQMGRVSRCTILITGQMPKTVMTKGEEHWDSLIARHGLSPAQSVAARESLAFLQASQGSVNVSRFLFWAVTGAGKTEMIFPLIDHALQSGRRMAIATPRKDVVVELAPRLQKAFPASTIVVLHGGSTQTWERGHLVLATTHQLLRFYHAFDLLVVDELDAFPYHNNPMLQYAAHESIRPGGVNMFLSATPPSAMQEQIRAGELAHTRVPVRFHRHPLPVPQRHHPWTKRMLPRRVREEVRISLERGAQVFVFVPEIARVDVWRRRIRSWFGSVYSEHVIEGTSSQDPDRAEKVQAFRDRKLRVLVTTTILERGVTVPKSDVLIVEADHRLFEEAALVQMAGRAGRHPDDPAGRVVFISMYRTQEQKKAIRQIRHMNRLAKKGGYLRQTSK